MHFWSNKNRNKTARVISLVSSYITVGSSFILTILCCLFICKPEKYNLLFYKKSISGLTLKSNWKCQIVILKGKVKMFFVGVSTFRSIKYSTNSKHIKMRDLLPKKLCLEKVAILKCKSQFIINFRHLGSFLASGRKK